MELELIINVIEIRVECKMANEKTVECYIKYEVKRLKLPLMFNKITKIHTKIVHRHTK